MMGLLINFLVLTFVVSGVIIFLLWRALISSTDGAVKRLNGEIEKANEKQAELNKKLKEADEELTKRRAEAAELADKMRSDAEEESKNERNKMISKAREEAEEVIAKAQTATDKMKQELEKEMDIKGVTFGMQILNEVLSENAKGAFNKELIDEFMIRLKDTEMGQISGEVNSIKIISTTELDDKVKKEIGETVKKKMGREVSVETESDPQIGGGMVLKFGSMALDGSVRSLIRERAIKVQQDIADKKYS